MLKENVRLYCGGRPVVAALLHGGRFALAAIVLGGAAYFGAAPLLTCALGLLIGRQLVMRKLRETRP
jgi:hypothetical protein